MIKWRGKRETEKRQGDRETERKKEKNGGRKRNEELCDSKSKNKDVYKTMPK